MSELPKLNRAMGPTPGATKFYRDLAANAKEKGGKVYNFGQGAEVQKPGGKIAEILAEPKPTITDSVYPINGGGPVLRDSAAAWVKRFLGIPATRQNTFAFGVQGRASLLTAFELAKASANTANIEKPQILMSDLHWPMLDSHAKRAGLKQKLYNGNNAQTAQIFIDTLAADKNSEIVAGYLNSPQNPTGQQIGVDEMKSIIAMAENTNKQRKEKNAAPFHLFLDSPYFMSCNQRGQNAGSYLDAGFDGVFDGANLLTPWIVNISFSKAYGMATPGFHLIVTHPAYADAFANYANETYGNAMDIALGEKVAQILAPENDREALAHFTDLKNKYTQNREALTQYFGDYMIGGESNMTCLLNLPEELLGHTIQGAKTKQDYHINDLNDFLEYCGQEKGVVFVNNGKTLARIAMAMKPAEFAEGAKLLREAFDDVMSANIVSASRQEIPAA